MDSKRIDAWTRRRLTLRGGSIVSSLVAGLALGRADAKKKRKKKRRCKRLGFQNCRLKGKKKRCCKSLQCEVTGMDQVRQCCLPPQRTCDDTSAIPQCCGELQCETIQGLDGHRCCGFPGDPCLVHSDCCFTGVCALGVCV